VLSYKSKEDNMFEIKDYGKEVEILGIKFNIDAGNVILMESIADIQINGIKELESLKDIDKETDVTKQMAIIKGKANKIIGWINTILCDSKAVDKILGEKKYSVQNLADLFAYVLNEITTLEVFKLGNKAEEYAPTK
jgi:hypothetical protein